MTPVIVNQQQYKAIIKAFENHNPKHQAIHITNSGSVLDYSEKSQRMLIGFVTNFEGETLRAISTEHNHHHCIYHARIMHPESPTEMEIRQLKERVARLEADAQKKGLF